VTSIVVSLPVNISPSIETKFNCYLTDGIRDHGPKQISLTSSSFLFSTKTGNTVDAGDPYADMDLIQITTAGLAKLL